MAIQEYEYQAVSHEDLELCAKWCQNQFQLRDWQIELMTGWGRPIEFKEEDIKTSLAMVNLRPEYLKAVIWIPIKRMKSSNNNCYQALIHEIIHIVCTKLSDTDSDEVICYTFEPLLYRLFCRENKKKIAQVK